MAQSDTSTQMKKDSSPDHLHINKFLKRMAFLPLYGARIMNINVIQIIICHFIWTQVGLGIGATTYSSGALIILKMEMGAQRIKGQGFM